MEFRLRFPKVRYDIPIPHDRVGRFFSTMWSRCSRPAHGHGCIDGLLHKRPRHGGRFYGAGMDVSLARVVPPDARRVRGHSAGPRDGRPFLLRVRHGRGHRPVLYGSVGERRFAHAGSRRQALGDARVRRTHPDAHRIIFGQEP